MPLQWTAEGTVVSLPGVTDTFNRGDDASSLGTASDGIHVWTTRQGTIGILSNAANASGRPAFATVEYGAPNCTIQFTALANAAAAWGIIARFVDVNNYILFQNESYNYGVMRRYRMLAGVLTVIDVSTGIAPATNDVFKVILSGSSLKAYLNAAEIMNVTDSNFLSATAHGIWCNDPGSPNIDNFSIIA